MKAETAALRYFNAIRTAEKADRARLEYAARLAVILADRKTTAARFGAFNVRAEADALIVTPAPTEPDPRQLWLARIA